MDPCRSLGLRRKHRRKCHMQYMQQRVDCIGLGTGVPAAAAAVDAGGGEGAVHGAATAVATDDGGDGGDGGGGAPNAVASRSAKVGSAGKAAAAAG